MEQSQHKFLYWLEEKSTSRARGREFSVQRIVDNCEVLEVLENNKVYVNFTKVHHFIKVHCKIAYEPKQKPPEH